jgi:hypothetical protein
MDFSDGVPLAFKMEQPQGVSLHNPLQSKPKTSIEVPNRALAMVGYFT